MDYNNIGINSEYDRYRIRHLLKIGIFSALLVLIGDMLLGRIILNPPIYVKIA